MKPHNHSSSVESKLKEIGRIAAMLIARESKAIPAEIRALCTSEQDKMEFQLKQLVEEVKQREADIKIGAMTTILNLIDNVH